LTGFFTLMYVPSQLIVPGDAAATVARLQDSRPLFGFGIAAGIACYTAFLLLPLALYRLLSRVDREVAVLMVALAVVSVPLSLYNLSHKLDVLSLLGDSSHLQVYTAAQV